MLSALLILALIESSDMRQGEGKYQTVLVVDPEDLEHHKQMDKKLGTELHATPVLLKGNRIGT
jgi:hypothetical protein